MKKERQIEEMARVIAEVQYLGGLEQKVAQILFEKGYRKQSEWISVEERLPTHEENDQGLVGIVNGHNGKIGFMDAFIFVDYDFDECEWFSDEYDLANCKVDYWMVIPIPTKMKGGAE